MTLSTTISTLLQDLKTDVLTPYSSDLIWIIVLGFIFAFILAFALGANDVANSFGTSVGSGVLTLTSACILATIFEISGAILLGDKVSATIRKGIVDISIYEGSEMALTLGYISTLSGCAIWLFIATYFKLPVSGTHSTVAATVGYSLVARGTKGINWVGLGKIVASWFISPVLSGLISVVIFYIIQYAIMRRFNPLKAGLIGLPIIYGLTVFINVFGVTKDGPKMFYLDGLPLWVALVASIVAGFFTALIVQLFVVPWTKKKLLQQRIDAKSISSVPSVLEKGSPNSNSVASLESGVVQYNSQLQLTSVEKSSTKEEADQLFNFLQILTAIFGSFAHGGNDVANAVGPLIALWLVFSQGTVSNEPDSLSTFLLLLYGGVGIAVGLWVLGRRVIETIGTGLTKITPSTGFTIEIGSACTVLLASKLGMPVSTTHCKVGSVVFVGYVNGRSKDVIADGEKPVNWKLFGAIAISWIATVPAALGFSALIMWILSAIVL
uniref:Phosphate transporter n=1 Tax=Culicoides sonorensis TaxID=179676 RepID=A0A336LNR4_CULSO